jgi:organic hydroperoxide reductase OsmC/OhrA
MLGTLKAALEVRQVKVQPEDLVAEVEGLNELREGLPVLTAIRIHYRLRIPPGSRETADRALARHQEKCPTAASLRGSVNVSWTAEIVEA